MPRKKATRKKATRKASTRKATTGRRQALGPPALPQPVRQVKTFLLTNVKDSTPMWHDESMSAVQRAHDALLKALFAELPCHLFKTMGDGFFVAFDDPYVAVRAAVELQRQSELAPVGGGTAGPVTDGSAFRAGGPDGKGLLWPCRLLCVTTVRCRARRADHPVGGDVRNAESQAG